MNVTGNDIVDLDARAVRGTVGLVARIGPADLARPTPCDQWTLGELLAHMTAQHDGFAAAAAGDGGNLARWQPQARTGASAADLVRDYSAAAERVIEAFGAHGVLDRDFELAEFSRAPRFPAAQAISFHLVDYVVHGWDVARSLGLPYQPGPDLLAAALPVAQAVPDGEPRKQGLVPFAPGIPVAEHAGVLDQILSLLGRSPAWPD
ncbi:MAG: TIGR03086 family metal-binding protein [Streptosporangiaceae bacterium]